MELCSYITCDTSSMHSGGDLGFKLVKTFRKKLIDFKLFVEQLEEL